MTSLYEQGLDPWGFPFMTVKEHLFFTFIFLGLLGWALYMLYKTRKIKDNEVIVRR